MTTTATLDRTVSRRGALLYYLGALAIRTSDAGSAAAIVLLVLSLHRSGQSHAAEYGAILAACITFPHMLGPLSARVLAEVRSPRAGLCGAFVVYALFLLGGGLLVDHGHLLAAGVSLAVAGFFGPIFTGGLSSHLGSLVPNEQATQRRAQSADSLTYAVSNSVGNSVVGAVAAVVSPLMTITALCALAVVGAVLVGCLPLQPSTRKAGQVASTRKVVVAIATTRPLRNITIITYANAMSLGSMVVLATTFVRHMKLSLALGPGLLAIMGVGSLLSALYFIVRPLQLDVMTTARRCAVISGMAMLVPAVSDVWVTGAAFVLIGVCQALLNTAAFAVRREASPDALRASVFVTMAGAKIALASVGLAVAGLVPVGHVDAAFVVAGVLSMTGGLATGGVSSLRRAPAQSGAADGLGR